MSGTINITGPQTTPGQPVLNAPAVNAAVNAALATKAPLASPVLTGTPTIGTGGAVLTGAVLQATATATASAQLEVQNLSAGVAASSDFVATANDGTDTVHFIDLGINGSGNVDAAFTVAAAHDGYLYTASGNLAVGAGAASKVLTFFTGGTLLANVRATITDTGLNSTAIGATTPAAAAFTTLSATGLITPASAVGIKGSITNDSAPAGSVGEIISATVAVGSAVALTTAVSANVTSISLTAGDWDVRGTVAFTPAASTSVTAMLGGVSSTTAALPAATTGALFAQYQAALVAGAINPSYPTGPTRLSLAVTTTVFLVAQGQFTVSTMGAYGALNARRVR